MSREATHRPTVAVDLDGVLASYDGWKGIDHIGEPINGAREFLQQLRSMGYEILIHTTRLSMSVNRNELVPGDLTLFARVLGWLDRHDLPYDRLWRGDGKPIAVAYIDDRAIRCSPQTYASPSIAYAEALGFMEYLRRSGLMGHWGPEQAEAAGQATSDPDLGELGSGEPHGEPMGDT